MLYIVPYIHAECLVFVQSIAAVSIRK